MNCSLPRCGWIAGLLLMAGLCRFTLADSTDAPFVVSSTTLQEDGRQNDFPAMCLDQQGVPWVVYVQWDGNADTLHIARRTKDGLESKGAISRPGLVHQPSLACDGSGNLWAIWSQWDEQGAWKLLARRIVAGQVQAETVTLDDRSGNAVFSTAGTDSQGRVWVAWQSFRQAAADIFAKCYDPVTKSWSDEIRVSEDAAGDWEPRIAFPRGDDAAWIAFDSSRGGIFNVYVARVRPSGVSRVLPVSESLRYEARPSIAATPDGEGLWLAWESGSLGWGRNTRGVDGGAGLNADKRVQVACLDIASGRLTEATDVTAVLRQVDDDSAKQAPPKPKAKPAAKRKAAAAVLALNLPTITVDADGNPWLACRYYRGTHWKIALTRYEPQQQTWTRPVTLANSSFGQDRRCHWARDEAGKLWLAWPSDRRTSKRALTAGVYLAQIESRVPLPTASIRTAKPVPAKPIVRWGDDTPERLREDRHKWADDGKTFGLYWGDFHRHTDVSNCRTPQDGCIVEQFRYAYDIGRLDMLGTSDHTDIGKPYDPYEWWCNQKLADVFHSPEFFTTFYVYEREQRWPWGHRNVIFGERGGPIVYINRSLYRSMPWHSSLPISDGPGEISPTELWSLLRKTGKPVTVISHTGATGMGTDWDGYEKIDQAVENLVEIYQGARVSYEGTDTPQPQVGFPRGVALAADEHGSVKAGRDFGAYNQGVYRNALRNGHRLGVFANSDHISTNTSFGGVYAESFTREGLIEGFNARRTIAATDKIFMEFSCNGHLLGEEFETDQKPALKVVVHGTARLRAVTIVRNEEDFHVFKPENTRDLDVEFTDEQPLAGENRYYIRVEQLDGNMGWTSPVWVTYRAN